MATTLNVRNPRAHVLARDLAERRKTGITEAVIQALAHELERERAAVPLAQRLAAIVDHSLAKAGANPRPVTEAERDALRTR